MATNPYAAPTARVDDARGAGVDDAEFIPEGQALSAGQGWQWITAGWGLFRAQPAMWVGIAVVLLLFYVVVGLIPWIGQFATTLITPVIGAGLLLGCRAIDEGGELAFGNLFEGFKLPQMGRLIMIGAVSLLAAIIMVVAIIAVAGLGYGVSGMGGNGSMAGLGLTTLLAVLVALAISIPIYMALWFAPALITFHDYAPMDALKTSFSACLKNVGAFFVYGLVLFILAVVAMIPFGLGLLVLLPVIIASIYAAYRDVFFVN
jgi:uncharacterized membrane protein